MKIEPKQVFRLDGGMGTEMQKRGMPSDQCPEKWAFENPTALEDIYQQYQRAGSDAITSFTFGGSAVKLGAYGLSSEAAVLNEKLAQCAKSCALENHFVGGDVGPLGEMLEPNGEMNFDEAYQVFYAQIKALATGGADYIAIETMLDIQETRIALMAAKEACDLPVFTTLTFENGYTLMGTDPVTALVTLQNLGAAAVGSNCGAGPEQMLPVIEAMIPYAKVPIIAKPNAGLPELIDGETRYSMGPDEFAEKALLLANAGANVLGGCCGTTPEHIAALKKALESNSFERPAYSRAELLSSARRHWDIADLDAPAELPLDNFIELDPEDWAESFYDEEIEDQIVLLCGGFESEDACQYFCKEKLPEAGTYTPLPLGFSFTTGLETTTALRYYPGRSAVSCKNALNSDEAVAIKTAAERFGAWIID